jgi:hypothetical protein
MISYEDNASANFIIPIEATMAVDNPVCRRIVRRKRRRATPAPYDSPLRRPCLGNGTHQHANDRIVH